MTQISEDKIHCIKQKIILIKKYTRYSMKPFKLSEVKIKSIYVELCLNDQK